MAKRTERTYHLAFDAVSALCSTAPFSSLPEQMQAELEEYLQTAFCGDNRLDEKLLGVRLGKACNILGLDKQSALWNQLRWAIENALSVEASPPFSEGQNDS